MALRCDRCQHRGSHGILASMSPASADSERRKSYHHGALNSALVEASIALARQGGPDRVILREAARAAGVSHSAAYRHFADREALLAEVASFARNELAAQMRRRVNRAKDPRRRRRGPLTSTSPSPSPGCSAPPSPRIPPHRPATRTLHAPPRSPTPSTSL